MGLFKESERELASQQVWKRSIASLFEGDTEEAGRLHKFHLALSEMSDDEFNTRYDEDGYVSI